MKRFDVDAEDDAGPTRPTDRQSLPSHSPWSERPPEFDPLSVPSADWPFPQIPPRVQQAVSVVIREAIDAGLSLQQTYDNVVAILAHDNLSISPDELSGWVGSHALAVS